MHKLVMLLILAVTVGGCESSTTNQQHESAAVTSGPGVAPVALSTLDPTETFDQVYAHAGDALTIATAKNNVWSGTEALLDEARAAYAQGRTQDAITLAHEARLQAELAAIQADREQIAWRTRVLSK